MFLYFDKNMKKQNKNEMNINCIICKFCSLRLATALLDPCPRCMSSHARVQ